MAVFPNPFRSIARPPSAEAQTQGFFNSLLQLRPEVAQQTIASGIVPPALTGSTSTRTGLSLPNQGLLASNLAKALGAGGAFTTDVSGIGRDSLAAFDRDVGGLARGVPTVNFADIRRLLDQAQQQRSAEFAEGSLGRIDKDIRAGDVQGMVSQLQDLSQGLSGEQVSALRDRGLQNIQRSFLSSLRDLRGLSSDRSLPSSVAQVQKADLLRERLKQERDLEQSLIIDDISRRERTMSLLNQVLSSDIQRQQAAQQLNSVLELQERLNRLGTPELAAQLNLQAQQSNVQRGMSLASTRAQLAGQRLSASTSRDSQIASLLSQLLR